MSDVWLVRRLASWLVPWFVVWFNILLVCLDGNTVSLLVYCLYLIVCQMFGRKVSR